MNRVQYGTGTRRGQVEVVVILFVAVRVVLYWATRSYDVLFFYLSCMYYLWYRYVALFPAILGYANSPVRVYGTGHSGRTV